MLTTFTGRQVQVFHRCRQADHRQGGCQVALQGCWCQHPSWCCRCRCLVDIRPGPAPHLRKGLQVNGSPKRQLKRQLRYENCRRRMRATGGLQAGEDCGHTKVVVMECCSRMEPGQCWAMGGGGHGNGESVARLRAKTLTEQNVYLYCGLASPLPCITIGCVLPDVISDLLPIPQDPPPVRTISGVFSNYLYSRREWTVLQHVTRYDRPQGTNLQPSTSIIRGRQHLFH